MLPVSVASHTQQPGQSLQKEAFYPGGHGVIGGRGPVMDIDDKDSNNYREGDKNHNEEQVLSDQWDHLRVKEKPFIQMLQLQYEL